MAAVEFRMPDLGEGLTEADLVAWAVAVGDHVDLNQTIAEVETAKALVDLPSPYAGTVRELLVQAGETVPVGTPIIRIGTGADEQHNTVLVGYGPRPEPVSRRRTDAKPSARKLARELGVDLATVQPSGRAITVDDVRTHPNVPDRTTRIPVAGVRKRVAEAMTASARTIPQVTEFVTADVTATVELLEQLRTTPRFRDLSLTPLAFVAKAVVAVLGGYSIVNSQWDEDNHEIVLAHDVHLGIAVATERGLLVPRIETAQRLTLAELCSAIASVASRARDGSATPHELTGSTFTITNIGVFGIDAGTPIVPPGTAAILCLGAIAKRPWVVGDAVVPRWVTTLGLSFDHRIVDGEQASKFLGAVAAILHEPLELLGMV